MKKKAVKTKSKRAKPKKEQLELLNLKTNKRERKALKAMATKFAKGNVSAWLRYAGMHYKPAKSVHIS